MEGRFATALTNLGGMSGDCKTPPHSEEYSKFNIQNSVK